MRYLLGVVVLLGLGCKQGAKQINKAPDSVVSAKPMNSTNTEYLDWDSVKLNGTIPMLSSFKATTAILGKPDSIVTPDYDNISVSFFTGHDFKYVYYKGLQFEMENDSLAFLRIDFAKDTSLYLTSNKIRLGYATSLTSFKNIFPKAGDNELHHPGMDEYIAIDLDVSKKRSDDQWFLSFSTDGNKLLQIDYYLPN